MVKRLKIYLKQSNEVNYDYSYVIVGDLDGVVDNSYIEVEYEYSYLSGSSGFPRNAYKGY